jgi:tRNA-dihydrouridine synthase 1
MLTRSFLTEEEKAKMLAYTPMFHARLFSQEAKYRKAHFQCTKNDTQEPWLDGKPSIDRPLFVQFCANDAEALLSAAKKVAPYCDAVDLNLGCPQGIARKGHYGAFLQEDQDLIFRLINTLHKELPIPVTAKIRILEDEEKTLAYAQNVLKAGASILTVHGRRREQKGHLTGVADWKMLRFLRDSLPPETVIFANGNILQGGDIDECLAATGADAVMSAEGNLSDPALFATAPAVGEEGREYWRGKDGKGGWRVDGITRRYLDILHKYALGVEPPTRRPLFIPGDDTAWMDEAAEQAESEEPPTKRRKKDSDGGKRDDSSPNLSAMQPHLFHLLRHFVSKHTDIRDMLARSRKDGIQGYERVLEAIERRVATELIEYEATDGKSFQDELDKLGDAKDDDVPEGESSRGTVRSCKRPVWVAQPIIRPLPAEALAKGAIRLSKKELEAKAKGESAGKQGKKEEEVRKETKAETAEQEGTREEIQARDELVSG